MSQLSQNAFDTSYLKRKQWCSYKGKPHPGTGWQPQAMQSQHTENVRAGQSVSPTGRKKPALILKVCMEISKKACLCFLENVSNWISFQRRTEWFLHFGFINTISAQRITHIIYSADTIMYSGLLLGREISILDKNSEMGAVTVFVWYTE